MDKFDFKKEYKQIYKPSAKKPNIVVFPKMQYITISGEGNPNGEEFSNAISALYPVAYAISMSYKNNNFNIPNFYSFVVPPLEGIWDIKRGTVFSIENKDNLVWEIGLAMPEFINKGILNEAKSIAVNKTSSALIKNIELTTYAESTKCVLLHVGSYDLEKHSFDLMQEYIQSQGYKRVSLTHREIYLSDFRKTETAKLKTVLCADVVKL